jgi:hypothetical protein
LDCPPVVLPEVSVVHIDEDEIVRRRVIDEGIRENDGPHRDVGCPRIIRRRRTTLNVRVVNPNLDLVVEVHVEDVVFDRDIAGATFEGILTVGYVTVVVRRAVAMRICVRQRVCGVVVTVFRRRRWRRRRRRRSTWTDRRSSRGGSRWCKRGRRAWRFRWSGAWGS